MHPSTQRMEDFYDLSLARRQNGGDVSRHLARFRALAHAPTHLLVRPFTFCFVTLVEIIHLSALLIRQTQGIISRLSLRIVTLSTVVASIPL